MKLVVVIVHSRDRNRLTDALVQAGFKFTVIGSTGGFLREGNTTVLLGVDDGEVEGVKEIVRENCHAREQIVNVAPFESATPGGFIPSPVRVPVGGAVVFVLPVDEFERF
ncbi:MAG: cyclic-di-AMP receptor [Fimbriimonadaceae bacterium]|nr:cyclic-di-AMP receptor [Fimbriimonadaceae bacterium]QYK56264.1 MAG: cyclic-di-AMP receptor [Fimbriimonadaceae bacterium]